MNHLHFDLGDLTEGTHVEVIYGGEAAMKLVEQADLAARVADLAKATPRKSLRPRRTSIPHSGRWHLLVAPAPGQAKRGCSIRLYAPAMH